MKYEKHHQLCLSGTDYCVEVTAEAKVKPNSILFVVDSFGSLIGSLSAQAAAGKSEATDAAVIQDAAVYERLALSLAGKSLDVSILFIEEEEVNIDAKQFSSIQAAYERLGVHLFR